MRLLPLVLLLGCQPVTAIGDKIVGLTNPVLVGGLVLGTQVPEDERLAIALQRAGVADFTEMRLVVADALELRDIENALIDDALVEVFTPDDYELSVEDDGWYSMDRTETPRYVPGDTWRIEAILPDRVLPGTVDVPLPFAADFEIEPEHDPEEDLVIDLSGQGFDFAFATVYDFEGNERWTNAPDTNEDIVDFVLPGGEPVDRLVVPDEAFGDETLYVVGIAGMKRAPDDRIEGLNEALTAVLAGELVLEPMVGGSRLGVSGLVLGTVPPEPPLDGLIDAAGVDLDARIDLFVLDVLDAGEGVAEATVRFEGAPVPPADSAGYFTLTGLEYVPGAQLDLQIEAPVSEIAARFRPRLSAPVDAVFPPQTGADASLDVQLPGGPWAAGLATVIGPGGITWSNVPEEGAQWAALLNNSGTVTRIPIPPEAFPVPGAYALGVAALDSQPEAIEGASPPFSEAMVGAMRFLPLTVTP